MPVIIGEFGDSTAGQTRDAGGLQNVAAVMASGYGFLAFSWSNSGIGAADRLTQGSGSSVALTSPYGQQVAAGIRTQ
jgi:hypothetical protein